MRTLVFGAAARRARRRGLAGVGRNPALARPGRARDHLHAHRARASPSAIHRLFTHRSFKTTRVRPRAAGRARLDGRRGPGDRVGRHPPQAPPLLRPARATRTAPTSTRRPGWRGALRGLGARARRLDLPRQGHGQPRPLREGPARRPRPALHQPHLPALGGGRAGPPVRARRRADRHARRRAHRPALGRRGARVPPAPRRPSASTRSATSSAAGRSRPAISRATSPGSRRSRSARPGTTTTMPSQPPRATAWDAGSSTPAPGSSRRLSAATWPGTSSASAPDANRPSVDPRQPDPPPRTVTFNPAASS